MVNRGPQLVQLMNGYPKRRSAGSVSSRRQSAHMALSAATGVFRWPPGPLGEIEKEAVPSGGMFLVATRSILASGGASRSSATRNRSTSGGAPSTSANTPPASFPTRPPRPRPVASE